MISLPNLLQFLQDLDWKTHAFNPACFVKTDENGRNYYLKNPISDQFEIGMFGVREVDECDMRTIFIGCLSELDSMGIVMEQIETKWDGKAEIDWKHVFESPACEVILKTPEDGNSIIPAVPITERPRAFARNPLMGERKIKPLLFRWERIIQRRHPEYFATLNGWTNSFELDELERSLGISGLPGTFRASLSRFNGQQENTPDDFGHMRLFSAPTILEQYTAHLGSLSKDNFPQITEESAWGAYDILTHKEQFKHWVPFAQLDQIWYYFDFAPNEAGIPGQVLEVMIDSEEPMLTIRKSVVAENYEEWFEKVLIPSFL